MELGKGNKQQQVASCLQLEPDDVSVGLLCAFPPQT